jgi:uncharacterized protein (DUF1800 family)
MVTKLHAMLQPYKPTAEDPFDYVKAAHLLSRAGFGGTPEEIETIQAMGPQRAVEHLMDFPDAAADEQSDDIPDLSEVEDYAKNFREMARQLVGKTPDEKIKLRQMFQRQNAQAVQLTVSWWMKRMMHGPYPLQEKLVLFWHGHFTTSAKDERSAWLMWQQHELHRQMAAGNFKEYAHKISHDPAMLDYLNNSQNRKQHPNENYARELMELFTLGIGNYTENDIKEAARAFTGYAHESDEFIYRKTEHDTGIKHFMGKSGNFDGDDIVEIIFQNPECPKYISKKLFKFFVHEEPEDAMVESMGALLRENKFELRPLLHTMLTSKAFYSNKTIGAQIKSPVQLVVGTARLLDVDLVRIPRLRAGPNGWLQQMGQVPFFPPNVKGWPVGQAWINTSTLFVRYNTAVELAGGARSQIEAKMSKKGVRLHSVAKSNAAPIPFKPEGGNDAGAVVDDWVARLIQRPIAEEKREVLINALGDDPERSESVKKMVQLIVSMPEYQLC